jgi:hypothetical protein
MSTSWNGWRPPGMKDIDTGEDYERAVTTFIKNTCLRFLQIVYASREEGYLRYLDDEEMTEIKIADQHAFQLEATEQKPAIIAVRGGLNWQQIGMNQGMQSMERRTGEIQSTDLIVGSVGFSCLSRVGLEAEQIASDVFNLFKFFRRTLQKQGFFTIKSMSIGSEQLIDVQGEPKLFLVPVSLTCQVQDSWTLEPEAAARLKRMVIQGLTRVNEDDEGEIHFENEIVSTDNEGGN